MKESSILKIRAAIVIVLDVMLGIVLVLLFYIDKLVNETFYAYGLVFNLEWAEPYWIMIRVSMALIVIVILILSILDLPYPLLRKQS